MEGSWFKPHQALCWAWRSNLVTRVPVTFRSCLSFLFILSLIWNLLFNFWPVYVKHVFTLLGSTFLSVFFRFLTIVTKGNSNGWTFCSCGFGYSIILTWVTSFCFWLSSISFISCFIVIKGEPFFFKNTDIKYANSLRNNSLLQQTR